MPKLLFVTYQEAMSSKKHGEREPIERNLGHLWGKYPAYNEENTVVVSNFYNAVEDFQRNDIVLPEFDPKRGRTDFLDDMHMNYLY